MSIDPKEVDPNEIDLLVDGELTDDRRKRLLERFEHSPDGWRACALAFLEAQCWREQLGRMADEARAARALDRTAAPADTAPSPARAARCRLAGTLLAMSASFLVTMIGVGLVRMQWRDGDVSPLQIARQTPAGHEGGAARPLQHSTAPQLAANVPTLPGPSQPSGVDGRTGVLAVRMSGDDAQADRELLLPVVEAPHFNDGLLAPPSPMGVDPRLEALARQHGLQVERQRDLMPVHTDEGHDFIVPVNRYEFRPRNAADIQ